MTRVSVVGLSTSAPAANAASSVTRRDTQREATRARLFAEAVAEFQRVGFAAAEIAVVAARAGVSRGTFYVHFADKDAVLRELLLDAERTIAGEVWPLVEREASLAEVLRTVVDAVLRVERRLGRRLIRDLCGAQFRPGFVGDVDDADHPVQQVVVAAFVAHGSDDAVDRAVLFLTGLFGVLATAEGPVARRRRHLDLLVALVTQEPAP